QFVQPRHLVTTSRVFALSLICMVASAGAAADPLNIFVSPEGNDNFTGTVARNNHEKTDGPVQTLAHAREMIRVLNQKNGGKLTRPINVVLRGGTYWLLQPFELTPEDSGTAEFPIT